MPSSFFEKNHNINKKTITYVKRRLPSHVSMYSYVSPMFVMWAQGMMGYDIL